MNTSQTVNLSTLTASIECHRGEPMVFVDDFERLEWLFRVWPDDRRLGLGFQGHVLGNEHLTLMHHCFAGNKRVHALNFHEAHIQSVEVLGGLVRSLQLTALDLAYVGVDTSWLGRYLPETVTRLNLEGNPLSQPCQHHGFKPHSIQWLNLKRTNASPELLLHLLKHIDSSRLEGLLLDRACAQLDTVRRMVQAHAFTQLRHLALNDCEHHPSNATWKGLDHLQIQHLDLSDHTLDVHGLVDVFSIVARNSIQHLDLSGCELNDDALSVLGELPVLESLCLIHNDLSADAIQHLTDRYRSTLHTLDVSNNQALRPAEMVQLLVHTRPSTLKTVMMSSLMEVTDDPFLSCDPTSFIQDPWRVETLDMHNNELGQCRGGEAMVSAVLSNSQLHALDVSHNSLSFEGQTIGSWQCEHLDVSNNDITTTGFIRLIEHLDTTLVRSLRLNSNHLCDDVIEHLHTFTALTTLDLSYNPISLDGIIRLVDGANWEHLTELNVSGIALNADVFHTLNRSCPNLSELVLDEVSLNVRDFDVLVNSTVFEQLSSLSVNHNMMGDGALSLFLRGSIGPTLRSFSIDGNGLGDAIIALFLQSDAAQSLDYFSAIDDSARSIQDAYQSFMRKHPHAMVLLF